MNGSVRAGYQRCDEPSHGNGHGFRQPWRLPQVCPAVEQQGWASNDQRLQLQRLERLFKLPLGLRAVPSSATLRQ